MSARLQPQSQARTSRLKNKLRGVMNLCEMPLIQLSISAGVAGNPEVNGSSLSD